MMCLLGTVVSWAETETVTVKSWDFTGQATDNGVTAGTATITEASTTCTEAATPACCEGLYLQNPTQWKSYKSKENGLRNVSSGDRMVLIPNLKKNDVIVVTCTNIEAINTTKYTGTDDATAKTKTFTMEADGNFYFKIVKSGGKIDNVQVWPTINSIVVTREVEAGTCENPSYKITGVDGEARKFTLACTTTGASIFYSDKELEAGAEGWTAYEGEVTTGSTKIYAYASANGAKSEVINFETGAGSKLTLNAPYANKTAYANGSYTVSIGSDQSSLSFAPSTVTYHYSIDGAAYVEGATATLPAGSTLTAYATAEGYTQSSNVVCVSSIRPNLKEIWKEDYTEKTKDTGNGAYGVITSDSEAFAVGERNFYNIIGYNANSEAVSVNLNTNVGINTATGFSLRCNGNNSGILKNSNSGGSTGYIGIQNLTPGQYIVITTNGNPLSATEGCEDNLGMNTTSEYYFTATATEASIFFQHGVYNYVKSISVLAPVEQITVNSTGVSTYVTKNALDFSNVKGLTALIVTAETEDAITLAKVTEVPAGTPIVVRGTPETTYTVPTGTCTALSETNLLSGSLENEFDVSTATTPVYAIKNTDGEFHPVQTTVTIPAGFAYLISQFSTTLDAKPMIIAGEEEDPTAVANVTAIAEKKASARFFNAAGQQVSKNYKGFIIDENGKKYFNK